MLGSPYSSDLLKLDGLDTMTTRKIQEDATAGKRESTQLIAALGDTFGG